MPSDLKPTRLSTRLSRREQAASKAMGLRERHKIDKLERIADAAIALFGQDGYDRATLRDIAREADVALGTLSLYARDKRDLVLLIFNKVIPPLIDQARRKINSGPDLVENTLSDNLIAFFQPFYETYAAQATLYRIVLGQIYNGPESVHAHENFEIRVELIGCLSDLILRAAAAGQCRSDVDAAAQSRALFYIYFAAVRVWLFQDPPEPAEGLRELKTLYDMHIRGLEVR